MSWEPAEPPNDPDREERYGMALAVLCCLGFFGGGGFLIYCLLR